MRKVALIGLTVIFTILANAGIKQVSAGYVISDTDKKAVEQGFARFTIPAGEREPISQPCVIRALSNSEISSLIEYCKSSETSWSLEKNNCEISVKLLSQRFCDDNSIKKPLNLPLTSTPTITSSPTLVIPAINNTSIKHNTEDRKIGDMTINELVELIIQTVKRLFK